MRITVECCGPARHWCGADRLSLDLPESARVADAITTLSSRYPELAAREQTLAWVIGDRVVPRSHALEENVTLAVIPPVSGG